MDNIQLSLEDHEIKMLKENVYMLQEQLNTAHIRIKELTEHLTSALNVPSSISDDIPADYWDGSLTYEDWFTKYQQDREA